jgi:hypothetical protein
MKGRVLVERGKPIYMAFTTPAKLHHFVLHKKDPNNTYIRMVN